jgi:glutamate-1-semialdehyde aminotransferase
MNYTNSLKYLERARKVIPGAAQTLSKMPARFPQGAFPVAVSYGGGAKIMDIDGNEYVDWIGALGAVPLGYDHEQVTMAAEFQLCRGGSFSLPCELEADLAERLRTKIPCAEMVRFVNSGSEATEAAIRTARIATGRDIILTVGTGYHSWHSWFQAVKDWHPGVPRPMENLVMPFKYNDIESLKHIYNHWPGQCWLDDGPINGVAAVIMEPCLFEAPKDDFLKQVREFCTESGILLIFDEMVTGYRWALAGGQEYFKVTPDLATYGKGMANGLPIGMLCGKREYMQHAELISGTFGGNAVSLAAANAVLDVYESEPVIETMWKRGEALQSHFLLEAFVLDVSAKCDGYACKPRIKFTYDTQELNDKAMSLFLQVAAEYGALFHPGGLNVCYALTDDDMKKTKFAITQGLGSVRNAIRKNDWSELKGDLIKPVVTVRQ